MKQFFKTMPTGISTAVFFILSLLLSIDASAVSRPGAVTFNFAGGYEFFSSKRPVENAGLPYFVLGYDFSQRWGIEGLLSVFRTHMKQAGDNRHVNGTLFAIDGVYRFSPYRFIEPFVLAGVGATGLNPNGNDANNEGNINAGLGALLFVNNTVAFRIEGRDFYTIIGGKNDLFLGAGITFLLDTA